MSIDYGKSPEYPYPWALEECFDAYTSINDTHGSVVGLSGKKRLKITVIGDSAYTIYMIKCSSNTKSGGNLAVGVVMKAIESESDIPCGLLLIYPCLSFDLNCWMPNSHLNLMRAESFKSISNLINSKQVNH